MSDDDGSGWTLPDIFEPHREVMRAVRAVLTYFERVGGESPEYIAAIKQLDEALPGFLAPEEMS